MIDINNAFVQGKLDEKVFMSQSRGFINPQFPTHVGKLKKTIYGLKHAPGAWYNALREHLLEMHFVKIKSYDIIFTGNHPQVIKCFISSLAERFSLKGLGYINYFLGIEVKQASNGLILSQSKYILDILSKLDIDNL